MQIANRAGSRLPGLILCLVVLLTLSLAFIAWLNPPAVFPDPAWGFEVIRSMERGSSFNQIVSPNHADIAQNGTRFLTWWSPGQYLVPYLFKLIFKVNYGQASVLTTLCCELLGLAGFYAFFKRAGFNKLIAAISIALIASQQFYFTPYIFYNGGEVTLFAFAGWFLYGCFCFNRAGWKAALFIVLAGWIGFISKSAFLWIYLAGLFAMWIHFSFKQKDFWGWIRNGFMIAIPALISLACIYIFFLSKGDNPASEPKNMKLTWETFLFPLASPLLSGFSVDDLCGGLIENSDEVWLSYAQSVLILLALAALSLVICRAILRNVEVSAAYKIVITTLYAVAVVFFAYVFLRQLDISYEGRHFRVLGLIFIPGLVFIISRLKFPYRLAAAGLWLLMSGLSLVYLLQGIHITKYESAHGSAGISQQFIDPYSLKRIQQIDHQYRNAIFVFTTADLPLEINHNRVIILQHVGIGDELTDQESVYKGHAGPLFILFPPDDEQHQNQQLLHRYFPNYRQFKSEKLSEDYVLYSAE
ncbi:hypothetical protein GCM10027037_16870 [Mucilaginibacter koreensis]